MRGGELFDRVVAEEGLAEAIAAPIFAQLCDSLHTAHGLGVVHRDLKLENVLLVTPSVGGALGTDARIKLIDWGLSHQHTIGLSGLPLPEKLHARCGSRSYMAPEVRSSERVGGDQSMTPRISSAARKTSSGRPPRGRMTRTSSPHMVSRATASEACAPVGAFNEPKR